MKCNLYFKFSNGEVAVTRFDYLRDAAEMYAWLDDHEQQSRFDIRECWVTEDGSSFALLGEAPGSWTASDPSYENIAANPAVLWAAAS